MRAFIFADKPLSAPESHATSQNPQHLTDDEGKDEPHTPKKKRKRGAAFFDSRFDAEWTKTWPFITKTKSTTEFRYVEFVLSHKGFEPAENLCRIASMPCHHFG
jgi:hypothetical protein